MNKKVVAMFIGGAVVVLAVVVSSSDHVRVRYALHALHRAVEDEDVARFARWADVDAVAESLTVVLPGGAPFGRGAIKIDTGPKSWGQVRKTNHSYLTVGFLAPPSRGRGARQEPFLTRRRSGRSPRRR